MWSFGKFNQASSVMWHCNTGPLPLSRFPVSKNSLFSFDFQWHPPGTLIEAVYSLPISSRLTKMLSLCLMTSVAMMLACSVWPFPTGKRVLMYPRTAKEKIAIRLCYCQQLHKLILNVHCLYFDCFLTNINTHSLQSPL